MLFRGSSGSVRNNIFLSNGEYGISEYDIGSDPDVVSHNLFYNNSLGLYLDKDTTAYTDLSTLEIFVPEVSDNLEGPPGFVNEGADDFHLASGSLCLDAGTTVGAPTTDFDGEPRYTGTTVDIGPDEYHAVHPRDANGDHTIDNWEMLRAVDDWAEGTISQAELDAIRKLWRGEYGYRSDGAGGYEPR